MNTEEQLKEHQAMIFAKFTEFMEQAFEMFVCNAIKNFSDGKGVTCPHCEKTAEDSKGELSPNESH